MNKDTRENRSDDIFAESAEELYEMAPCGYLTTTPDGRIVKVNRTLSEWLGYSAEELTDGRRFIDLLTAGGRIFYETQLNLLLRMQATVDEIALDLIRSSGTVIPALVNARQKRNAAGEPVLNRFTVFNATERRMYERDLLATRDLLRITLSSIGDGVVASDGEGMISFMNPVAEDLTGWSNAAARGKPIDEVMILVREGSSEPIENPVRLALRTGETAGLVNDAVLISKTGRRIFVDDSASPIRDSAGKIVGGVLVFRDISERRKNEQLERAQVAQLYDAAKLESLGRMAGGIAHDFNNLLTGILGYATLLREAANAQDASFLDEILKAGERAAGLAKQMLDYAGKGILQTTSIEVDSYLRNNLSLVRGFLSAGVTLKIEAGAAGYFVEADPARLQQVMMNLLTNASESMAEAPGQIILRTKIIPDRPPQFSPVMLSRIGGGTYVALEVQDSGTGIPPDTLRKIFDPFFTTKFTGRGLGLSAVLGIVSGHGGDIAVASQPGAGSTFQVLLPVSRSVAAPVRSVAARPPSAFVRRAETILVVDDEDVVRKLAMLALKSHGMRVVGAVNGSDALAVLAAEPGISAMILDLTMPVMNGEEALPLIQAMRPNLPVIVSSGFSEAEISRRFETSGVAGVLSKPYTVATIVSKVTDILTNRRE